MPIQFGISSKQTQLFALGIFSWYASRIFGFIISEIYETIWVISGSQSYRFIFYSKHIISIIAVISILFLLKKNFLNKVSIEGFSFKKSVITLLITLIVLIIIEFLYGFYAVLIFDFNRTSFEVYNLVKQSLNQFGIVNSLKSVMLNLVSIFIVIDWKTNR